MESTLRVVIVFCSIIFATLPALAQADVAPVAELRKQLGELWAAKNWAEVEAISKQIIATGQAETHDYRNLRVALSIQGKAREALELRLSIAQRPDAKSDDHNGVCWAYLEENKPIEARPHCQKAVDLKFNNAAALVNLGHTWLLMGEQNKANPFYRKALRWIDKEDVLKSGPLDDFNYFIKKGWASTQAQAAKTWFEQGWGQKEHLNNMIGEVASLSTKEGQEAEAMRMALKSIDNSTALLGEDAWQYVRVFGRLYMGSAAKRAERKSLPDIDEGTKKTLRDAYDAVVAQADVGDMMEFWNGLAGAHRNQDQNATALYMHQMLLALLQKRQLAANDERVLRTMAMVIFSEHPTTCVSSKATTGYAEQEDYMHIFSKRSRDKFKREYAQKVVLEDGRKLSPDEIETVVELGRDSIAICPINKSALTSISKATMELTSICCSLSEQPNVLSQIKDGYLSAAFDSTQTATKIRIATKKTALAQMDALLALFEELFSEQGLQTMPIEEYKSKAVIVDNVLTNPILTDKPIQGVRTLTPDTISLLKSVELSLSQGRNPFTTMSAASKAKLKAILK